MAETPASRATSLSVMPPEPLRRARRVGRRAIGLAIGHYVNANSGESAGAGRRKPLWSPQPPRAKLVARHEDRTMNRATDQRGRAKPLAASAVLGGSRSTRGLIALALAAAFAVVLSVALQRPAPVVVPPAPTHYLDDRAGLLSPGFVAAKNQYLEYLSRTMRIANVNVVILPPAPVPDVEAFSIEAASAWKIGARGADNGLALFVFPGNRQMRMEVGYGLEHALTDAQASSLLNEQVVPAFARGQYETGIEDFLSALDKLLTSSEAAEHRAAQSIELLPFVMKVLRTSPSAARMVWYECVLADTGTRFAMALFGAVLAGLVLYALAGILLAIPAIVLLPWRIRASPTLRAGWAGVSEQFSAANFIKRPPPVLVSLFNELELGTVVNALYLLAGLVGGIAFLFATSGWFMEGLGRFGGAGATIGWPGP